MSRVLDPWAGMTGTVLPYAGGTAPEGWLLCFGQAGTRPMPASLADIEADLPALEWPA